MKVIPFWICLLVIVILLALIIYVSTHRKDVTESVSQFGNNSPKSIFVNLINEFDSPQIIINQKGGFVIWFPSKVYENSPYESIILKDEEVSCLESGDKTKNFLYTTIIVDIPPHKMNDILSINKNIYYDYKNKEFTVRGDSMISNKRTLFAILKYLTDSKLSIQEVKKFLQPTWSEKFLNQTPLASTTFSDKLDDDIFSMIGMNLPNGYNKLNREFMLL